MSFWTVVSFLSHATFHPRQTMQAAYATLSSPAHKGVMRQYVELLSRVSINGLQLLTVCPKLISLLGTRQMEQVALQGMALLQDVHSLLQSSEVKMIAEQASSPAAARTSSLRCCPALSTGLIRLCCTVVSLCLAESVAAVDAGLWCAAATSVELRSGRPSSLPDGRVLRCQQTA